MEMAGVGMTGLYSSSSLLAPFAAVWFQNIHQSAPRSGQGRLKSVFHFHGVSGWETVEDALDLLDQ